MSERYLRLPVVGSPTRVELASRCARRHMLNDLLHLLPPEQNPHLGFGKVAHDAVLAFWRACLNEEGWEIPGARAQAYGEAREILLQSYQEEMPAEVDYMTQELAELLLEEYVKHARPAGNLPGTWQILELEQRREVSLPLPSGSHASFSYQTDRLCYNPSDDAYALVDLKTAGKLGPRFREGMQQSIQQRLYKALESRRLGCPVDFLVIEGIQKKVAPGTVEYVWANEHWTQAFEQEAVQLARWAAEQDQRVLQYLEQDDFDARWQEMLELVLTRPDLVSFNYQDCHSYYRPCEYHEICFSPPEDRVGLALGELEYRPVEYAL